MAGNCDNINSNLSWPPLQKSQRLPLIKARREWWPSSVDFGSTIALSTSPASSGSTASRSWKLTNCTQNYILAIKYNSFNFKYFKIKIMTVIKKQCDLRIIELVFERASLHHRWSLLFAWPHDHHEKVWNRKNIKCVRWGKVWLTHHWISLWESFPAPLRALSSPLSSSWPHDHHQQV